MAQTQSKLKEASKKLIKILNDRSQDVILRRFGIGRLKKETLDGIGQGYGITRERVRQIEREALNKLKSQGTAAILTPLFDELSTLISEEGGLMRETRVIREFVSYFDPEADVEKMKGFTLLLLELSLDFKRQKETSHFYNLWYTQRKALEEARKLILELKKIFIKNSSPLKEDQVVALLKKNFPFFSRRAIFCYIDASREIDQNIFGDLGLSGWSEINPRGVRDKAYLVLKKEGKPLHFRVIAEAINKVQFSKRKAKPQTVHNEVIKDKRFVLVGRGLYALSEWGYRPGTVREVLCQIFKDAKKNILNEKEVIERMRKERFVKDSTIRFNLKNCPEFVEKKKGIYEYRP